MLRMLIVAAYDVGNNRERRHLEQHLAGVGERAQCSVFEAWLSERERSRLLQTVTSDITLNPATDSIRWYGVCSHCQHQIRFAGRGMKADDPRFYIV